MCRINVGPELRYCVGSQAGNVVIYWNAAGTALFKTPSGDMMHGKWEINGDTLCADWKEKPGTGSLAIFS